MGRFFTALALNLLAMIVFSIATAAPRITSAVPNCAAYSKVQPFTYFKQSHKAVISSQYNEHLLRKASAIFWKMDTSIYSVAQIIKFAGNAYSMAAEDPEGNLFATVDIGFDDEKSIRYVFKFGTVDLLPIAIYDGACFEQGEHFEFPFDVKPKINGRAVFNCKVDAQTAPKADNNPLSNDDPRDMNAGVRAPPFLDYTLTVDTEDGIYTGSDVTLEATPNPKFANVATIQSHIPSDVLLVTEMPTQVTTDAQREGPGIEHVMTFQGRYRGDPYVRTTFLARASGDSRIDDFKATCTYSGALRKAVFKRFVRY